MLYLDVDRFKSINDSLGHAVGDAVLVEFAARLIRAVRAAGTELLVATSIGIAFSKNPGEAAAASC